jgi:hypothetical protein
MRLTALLVLLAAAPAARAQCSTERALLTASDGTSGDRLGISVALDGGTAVVGAAWDDVNGEFSGSAYVFERDLGGPNAWGEVTRLEAADANEWDWFGMASAVFGDTAAVGAPRKEVVEGAVYLFERNRGGPDAWGQVAKLTPPVPDYLSDYGEQLALFEDTVVVGAAHEETAFGENSGTVYVYERDLGGPDSWGLRAQLFSSDLQEGDQFGASVAISGDTLVVGATLEDELGDASGAAYVFVRDDGGPDAWGEVSKLTASDGDIDSYFGSAIAIHGDTVLVGAIYDDDLCDGSWWCDAGAAYLFERDLGGPQAFGQVRRLVPSLTEPGGNFGQSVALGDRTALVGAHRGVPGAGGVLFAFERDLGAPGAWAEADVIVASTPQIGSKFAVSSALSNATALVGAFGQDAVAPLSGAAYVFERDATVPYCTAGRSASGCRAILTACGSPSATAPSGFVLFARDVEGARPGLVHFGVSGRQAVPWGASGFQCVASPLMRTHVLAGTGTPGACDGSFALDLNAVWCPTCPAPHLNPGAGAVVQAQLWYRQPAGPDGHATNLSNAVEFSIVPDGTVP